MDEHQRRSAKLGISPDSWESVQGVDRDAMREAMKAALRKRIRETVEDEDALVAAFYRLKTLTKQVPAGEMSPEHRALGDAIHSMGRDFFNVGELEKRKAARAVIEAAVHLVAIKGPITQSVEWPAAYADLKAAVDALAKAKM